MGACKLTKKQLDARGNRESGWGINEKRGNRPYYPPLGWIGIGLNVMDKYESNVWPEWQIFQENGVLLIME